MAASLRGKRSFVRQILYLREADPRVGRISAIGTLEPITLRGSMAAIRVILGGPIRG